MGDNELIDDIIKEMGKYFTTIRDLRAYIEDLMGSEGSYESAKQLKK